VNRGEKAIFIIFIDGLSYDLAKRRNLFKDLDLSDLGPITPGIGYSVNQKVELFSGLKPDEVGFFCEWGLKPSFNTTKVRRYSGLLRPIRNAYILDGLIHKMVNFWYDTANIPFHLIGYFSKIKDGLVYSPTSRIPSIFKEYPIERVLVEEYGEDDIVFEEALRRIPEVPLLFISIGELDLYAHHFGLGSEKYEVKLVKTIENIANLVNYYRKIRPQGYILILSDHGMAEVTQGISLNNMEKEFGEASEKTFIYFQDSTIMRVWVFDTVLYTEIEDYLQKTPFGKVLSPEERKKLGVSTPDFGSCIFILKEGYIFRPSFHGLSLRTKAMHGYHPECKSQKTICYFSGSLQDLGYDLNRMKLESLDVFELMRKLLKPWGKTLGRKGK